MLLQLPASSAGCFHLRLGALGQLADLPPSQRQRCRRTSFAALSYSPAMAPASSAMRWAVFHRALALRVGGRGDLRQQLVQLGHHRLDLLDRALQRVAH